MDELPPIGMLVEGLLLGFCLPALLVVVVLACLRRFGPKGEGGDLLGGALALAGGFLASYVALRWPPLVPTDCWHWLPWLAVLASVAALLDKSGGIGTWCGRLLVALLAARLLVPTWEELAETRGYWLTGLVVAVVLLWWLLDHVSQTGNTLLPCLSLGLVTLAGSIVLAHAGSAKFAQLAGILCAILAALAFAAWRWPERRFLRGAVPGFAVLLPGLMLAGSLYTYSDVPKASFLLIAAAPLGLAILVESAGWRRGLIRLAAVLVPVLVGIALALAT